MNFIKKIEYYFWASYRRKKLDMQLEKNSPMYQGVVLDIGGRDRGRFEKPKTKVKKWIFADINRQYNPDIIVDVTNMPSIQTKSIDVVNAIELFEHVKDIHQGINECVRVLKNNGIMIISMPFLYSIHSDPNDYQRWTKEKWVKELTVAGMKIIIFEINGKYFTVMGDMLKYFIKTMPKLLRILGYLFYPLIDAMVSLDKFTFVQKNKILNNHHAGYFIICQKK